MKASWFRFFLPPKFISYEKTQMAKLLHYMLLGSFTGGMIFGSINLSKGWLNETVFLFSLAAICLAGFYLNWRGQFGSAALILCASMYVVLGLMLYNGIGLHDETVLAYPIFMLSATFLFGRRGLWISTILSIAALAAIYLLDVNGVFVSKYPASVLRVALYSALLVLIALVIWVVRDTWEDNLNRIRESYEMTLRGWARALEYRDGETAGHSQRVTRLCLALAQALHLGEEEMPGIRYGSYLHDIGKMAIPDYILLKPGPLMDDEWEIMKQHTIRSREFIAEIPFLQAAIPIAYYHHEHWDGTGYPDGLKGEEIPLSARIFTVVDSWDALNSDRPYRQAWPEEKVIAYLQENSGKIYDPHIVEVFVSVIAGRS